VRQDASLAGISFGGHEIIKELQKRCSETSRDFCNLAHMPGELYQGLKRACQ